MKAIRASSIALFNFALLQVVSSGVVRADTVTIEGVTLLCNSCSIIESKKAGSDDVCQIRFFVEGRTLTCEDGLRDLLEQTVRSGSITPPPTVAELRRFLQQPNRPKELAKPALSLMLRQESGERALINEAGIFAEQYPVVFSELFAAGEGGLKLLKSIWQIPKAEGVPLHPALRAALALRLPEVQFEDLISDLSISDVGADAEALQIFATILRKGRPEWATAAEELRMQLLDCGAAALVGESGKQCRPVTAQPASAKYLTRVQVSQTLQGLLVEKPLPVDLIARLQQLDIAQFRTPDGHAVILSLVEAMLEQTEAKSGKLLIPETRAMIRGFAENDRQIGEKYAELLTRRAFKVWQDGNDKEAVSLMDESYAVWLPEIPSRTDLLGNLRASPSLMKDPAAKDALARLGQTPTVKLGSIFSTKTFQKLGSIFFSIIGLVLIFLVTKNLMRRVSNKRSIESLEWKEQQMQREIAELKALLKEFNMGPKPTARELGNVYRKLAKETHPDKNPGSGKKFTELTTKYKRAKELLQRYYRNL